MGGSHGQFSIKVMIDLLTGQCIVYVVQTVLNWMCIYIYIHPDCIEIYGFRTRNTGVTWFIHH